MSEPTPNFLDCIDELLQKHDYVVIDLNVCVDGRWQASQSEMLTVKQDQFTQLFGQSLEIGESIEHDISDEENRSRTVCYTRIK